MGPAPGSSVVDIPSMHGSFPNKLLTAEGWRLALGVMAWSVAWTAGAGPEFECIKQLCFLFDPSPQVPWRWLYCTACLESGRTVVEARGDITRHGVPWLLGRNSEGQIRRGPRTVRAWLLLFWHAHG